MFSSMSSTKSMGFSPLRIILWVTVSFITLGVSYSTGTNSNLPASILEISRTSLTRPRRLAPALAIFSTFSLASSPNPPSSRVSSERPITALSGVRISWLILAKNLLFSSVAAIAVWSSTSSVTSSELPTMPIISPPASYMGIVCERNILPSISVLQSCGPSRKVFSRLSIKSICLFFSRAAEMFFPIRNSGLIPISFRYRPLNDVITPLLSTLQIIPL